MYMYLRILYTHTIVVSCNVNRLNQHLASLEQDRMKLSALMFSVQLCGTNKGKEVSGFDWCLVQSVSEQVH